MSYTPSKLIFLGIAGTALLAPLAGRAQTLTLDQCVAIALKDSPDTASAN